MRVRDDIARRSLELIREDVRNGVYYTVPRLDLDVDTIMMTGAGVSQRHVRVASLEEIPHRALRELILSAAATHPGDARVPMSHSEEE